MANLVDNNLKLQARQAMEDIFDTFKRSSQVTFFKTSTHEITMEDPNFNADFPDYSQYNTVIEKTEESASFDARIWYDDHQPIRYSFEGDEDLAGKLVHTWGKIKIQVKQDGYNYLKDATRIKFLDVPYKFSKDFRQLGILGDFQFYEVILERVN